MTTLLSSPAWAQTIEAESGERVGTEIATAIAGYSGSGYVTGFDAAGDKVTMTFNATKGTYDLYVRYASPSGDKFNFIYVNGENLGSASFPASPTFKETKIGKVYLQDGNNTLAIVKDWGYFDVDNVRLSPSILSETNHIAEQLVTPQPSKRADSVYQLLSKIYGNAVLAGQYGGSTEFDRIKNISGRTPVIRGFDLMDYSPSRVEHGASSTETDKAIAWDAQRGMVTFCWHWNAPKDLIDQPGKEWWRGFYTEATTFDVTKAMNDPGSEEYTLILRDIDAIAVQLKKLADADVPVLWRPLHEAEGKWFWWGAKGAAPCKWLWKLLFDRLVNTHGLNNLIWVWTSTGTVDALNWYPGDDYVDVIGADIYLPAGNYGSNLMTFDNIASLYGGKKIIALSENGPIPDPEKMFVEGAGWSWFSTWSGGFITDGVSNPQAHISHVYNHDYVITLDEIDRIDDILAMLAKERKEEDEDASSTIFFPSDFEPRTAAIPENYSDVEKPSGSSTIEIQVDAADVKTRVPRYLFGNNANVYMTQMVDQPDLLDRITTLSPNIIRFPGGNLSSVFFWNAAVNQPPADAPSQLVDANGNTMDPGYWYGKNSAEWTLSVDNYYKMLEKTGSTGIITVNYGYARYSTAPDPVAAAAHLAAEWVRYDNGRTKFWEIGNESNGTWQAGYRINTAANQDGQPQIITGDLYGKHFRVFADSMRKAAEEIQHEIYIGAQLLAEAPANWWNNTDRTWNAGVFSKAATSPDFYIIHSYYTPYQANSSPDEILGTATTVTRAMKDYVTTSVSAAGLPPRPLALTEWNIFAEGSKQQASYINGMHAAIVVGELIGNQYALACRWDLANGWSDGNDHGIFSQGDQPGVPKWYPRPAYYYLYYFQKYFGDTMVKATASQGTDVLAYASKFSSGEIGLVVVNKSATSKVVSINVDHFGYGERFYFHSLTGGTDNGLFSLNVLVNGEQSPFTAGGPTDPAAVKARASKIAGGVKLNCPGRSVQYILIEKGDNIITHLEGKEQGIEVYPNPSGNNLRVKIPGGGCHRIEIVNARGAVIYDAVADPNESLIQMNYALSSGLYTLLIHRGRDVFRRKIFVY